MSEAIIVALIGGVVSVAGSWIINLKNERSKTKTDAVRDAQRDAKVDELDRKLDDRYERIEKKLDEHNGYAQKFAENNVALAKIQKDIEHLKCYHKE